MSNSPAFRFYPSDFWQSPEVQAMDLHEVGAYLSMLSAAWLSQPAGHLSDDDEKLRRWARMSREQWAESRVTLLAKFPLTESGTRANPRLLREAEKQLRYSASQAEKGRKGGRPKAEEKLELSEGKPELIPGLSPEKPSVSVSVSLKTKEDLSAYRSFFEAWNLNCGKMLPQARVTPKRISNLTRRMSEGLTEHDVASAATIAETTPFLRGENDRQWVCSFPWLIENAENIAKVLEGTYGKGDPRSESKGLTTAERARQQKAGQA